MRSSVIASAVLVICSAGLARADVKLPAIFGDHMVLQRDAKVPVWGTAAAGEQMTVSFGDAKATATAGEDGKWTATLDSLKASDKPADFTVTGKNTITLHDVLVGDVWVAAGQSNMVLPLSGASNASTEVPAADHPTIRLFRVGKNPACEPLTDCTGSWQLCTPATAANYSAVGYFFARDINAATHAPIGMIGTYYGGTAAQAWTSSESLLAMPEFKSTVKTLIASREKIRKAQEKYVKQDLPEWEKAHDQWMKEHGGAEYLKAMAAWTVDDKKAQLAKQPSSAKPTIAVPEPVKPKGPDLNSNTPTSLFNGMVAPIIPYAIKGAIWYQGESNADNSVFYRTLFPTMITDWRTHWGQGDFPFLWVQLPNFSGQAKTPTQLVTGWPGVREAQSMTLKLPNTAQAVTIDTSDGNLHPTTKLKVGQRMAIAARRLAYGEDIVAAGPTYNSMKIEGGKVRISFKNPGTGLTNATASSTRPADPLGAVTGFTIAGENHTFVWATATIDGDDVIVSSNEVANPVAVRYAWAANPACNLYNKEGFPASPFRTDDWVDPPKPAASKPAAAK